MPDFRNDDAGYLRWLDAHVMGYVLNCDGNPRAGYLKLHKATCYHTRERQNWTVDYQKICRESGQSLWHGHRCTFMQIRALVVIVTLEPMDRMPVRIH